jgi:hypothetical protein
MGRFLVVSEVAFGFIFLALVISYMPVLYQAFSRRELRSSLLDALDDWQTSAWDEQFPSIHQTLEELMHPQ